MRFALLILALVTTLTADIKLLRQPTYSKGKVAFSYLGDIWTVNENGTSPQRLTDNKARDIYPRYSPDGNWIAFSSNRDGNYDVYVVPASGGKPKQLTFHTADDNVAAWSPDGKRILFSSTRGRGAFPSVTSLFEVSPEGGLELPIDTDWGATASYSPDGKKLAFMRHPASWSRKHYRGSYAGDLWVMDTTAKTYTKLGDNIYKGHYLWPMYANNGDIYFVSDRLPNEEKIQAGSLEVMKSVNNIWKISDKGGKPTQVTFHTSGNLFFPTISADRKTIVYEENFSLFKLDIASGKSTEIRVDLASDSKDDDTPLVTISNNAEGFHLSPSNRRVAVSVHGEIFTVAADRGEPQRVTETPWREEDPRWSPNGKWIAFVSDRTGRQELFISDELGKTVKQLSDADCDKLQIQWGPDSKSILWSGSDHQLRRVEIDTVTTQVLAKGEVGNVVGAQFSPDGKWLAYAKQDRLLRYQVWVKNLSTNDEQSLRSDLFQFSSGAKWTPDGKKLVFLAGISAPAMASQGFRGSPAQLYSFNLIKQDKAPESRDINTEAEAQSTDTPQPTQRRPQPTPVNVEIDWDNIDRRIQKIGTIPGAAMMVVVSPDSRSYLVQASSMGAPQQQTEAPPEGPAMYVVREDGTGMQRLNTSVADSASRGRGSTPGGGGRIGISGNEPQWSRDGRNVYALIAGQVYSISVPAGEASDGPRTMRALSTPASSGASPRRVDFTVRMIIDRAAERKQVFAEAWRVMKYRFYDPNMHGVNWAAAQDKHASVLEHVADTEELHNVIMQMIGELNASHTGVSGGGLLPGEAPPERMQTRQPGFTMTPDSATGLYKVEAIQRKGPADKDYLKITPGHYVLSINGKLLKTTQNYWELLNVLPGRKLEFLLNSKPDINGAWPIIIDPLTPTAHANLEYSLWVEKHKTMVDKLTGGEVGYLHIRAMDAPSLQKFQEDLIDLRDKKALIIDQRFNGGGGIDQELLQILNQRKQYQRTRGRDSIDVARPVQAFYGPMVVLQNERSASDAEMFPDGFRRLGLGKLVGMPTMGAVIGTGSFTLMDGSQIRTPGSGVYTSTGENMENYGVPPDYFVDNGPADFLAGKDRQIEKAIEVLKSGAK